MGVVTTLQIVDYFTTPGRQPKHGIVCLFNNGEEDYLWGARAFAYSPMMPFIHTFVNLEGAGAGGRAMLFRTTDKEVTEAYSQSPHPFGSVIASDAFGLGAIKSQTDYVVFNGVYGQRGMDIAFYLPRARYHTNQDDVKHTSRESLWHMLSAAVGATEGLSGDTGDTFIGGRPDGRRDIVPNGGSSDGVWFDLFGRSLIVLALRGVFAWTLTLLIAAPLILLLITVILIRKGKYYFFTSSFKIHAEDSDEDAIDIGGWKGFIRFPFALTVASSLVLGSALLVTKFNPLIVSSSIYAVWVASPFQLRDLKANATSAGP